MMRKTGAWATVLVALSVPACAANAQTPYGSHDPYDDLGYFEGAIHDVYGQPTGPIPYHLHPDELPVVYLLAREAGVSPSVVIALREQGWSWLDITHHLRVDPYVYVARLPHGRGYWYRPYTRDYRYLTDRHIIDYVNVVFWADYHRRPVTHVILVRQRVPTWTVYVRYHAPPRTVVVYRDNRRYYQPAPVRGHTGRTAVPAPVRRAELRDAAPGTRGPAAASRSADSSLRDSAPARPSAERPAPSAERRAPAAPSTQRPGAAPQRPTAAPQRPAATPQRPAASPQRPAPAAQRPAPPPQRPSAAPARDGRSGQAASRPSAPSRGASAPARPSATRSSGDSRPAAQSRPSSGGSRQAPARPSSRRGGETD